MTSRMIHSSIPKTVEGRNNDAAKAAAAPTTAPNTPAHGISLIGLRNRVKARTTMRASVNQLTDPSVPTTNAITNITAPRTKPKNVPT